MDECSPVMRVTFNGDLAPAETKRFPNCVKPHFRLNSPVRVEQEAIRSPIKHDAPAWVLVILAGEYDER